ncbi:MAG: class A beta-lactamase, partial [Acidobacteriota bacterium]|nr:class A beta-lactamase [Acidobacteriota bacterium]
MIIHFRKTILFLAVFCALILIQTTLAQNNDSPKSSIKRIIRRSKGTIGVAVSGLEDDFSLAFNKDKRFPMQSVFKFPLALAILDASDRGKFTLDQKIRVTKQDLRPNTWSPLREDFPEGGDIALRDLLAYTVSKSDNNGCDILFRLAGGTKAVETYIHRLGIKDIAIVADEAEMAQSEDVQYRNWNKPPAMIDLLKKFYAGKVLSAPSTDFLRKIMVETSTGAKRIKGA